MPGTTTSICRSSTTPLSSVPTAPTVHALTHALPSSIAIFSRNTHHPSLRTFTRSPVCRISRSSSPVVSQPVADVLASEPPHLNPSPSTKGCLSLLLGMSKRQVSTRLSGPQRLSMEACALSCVWRSPRAPSTPGARASPPTLSLDGLHMASPPSSPSRSTSARFKTLLASSQDPG